jgi:hypothetical protein
MMTTTVLTRLYELRGQVEGLIRGLQRATANGEGIRF